MKQTYLDIIELSLSVYSDQRIRDFVEDVRRNGLTEHGFPRLGANIGILMAHGRQLERKDIFIEIMELCLAEFPRVSWIAGNNFSIREVCCALMELEKTDVIKKSLLEKWKAQLSALDPWQVYSHIVSEEHPTPHNWAYFAVVSEQARGLLCGIDATAFLEHQLPSQLLRLNENGMYRDAGLEGPHQPLMYDLVTRALLVLSFFWGYRGKYASDIRQMMELSDDLALKMQSVTGEIPFGGRSNQFLFSETTLASYYELRATLLAQQGDFVRASQFKAAAQKAAQACLKWLQTKPMSHIKNRFDPDLQFGCENYAYFNKYMITTASNAYLAYLAADDSIVPSVAPSEAGNYIVQTSPDFHKVFINSNGYFLEFDLNADFHYDANGLGRVQKAGVPSSICLSVPFPGPDANYTTPQPNPQPMSLCCAGGATVPYTLLQSLVTETQAAATFRCDAGIEHYTVTSNGIEIAYDQRGFMLPVFTFDGHTHTDIRTEENAIYIHYLGAVCTYRFNGTVKSSETYYNRNGQYTVYYIDADRLHITIA